MGESVVDEALMRELAWQITGIRRPSQSSDEVFGRTLEQTAAFHVAEGRAPETSGESALEARLGRWLEAQRAESRRGTLCDARRRMIDHAIGVGWAFDAISPRL